MWIILSNYVYYAYAVQILISWTLFYSLTVLTTCTFDLYCSMQCQCVVVLVKQYDDDNDDDDVRHLNHITHTVPETGNHHGGRAKISYAYYTILFNAVCRCSIKVTWWGDNDDDDTTRGRPPYWFLTMSISPGHTTDNNCKTAFSLHVVENTSDDYNF